MTDPFTNLPRGHFGAILADPPWQFQNLWNTPMGPNRGDALDWWPLMLRSNHEAVRRENFNLRGALGQANSELRKHRLLIGSLQQGHEQTTAAVERALRKQAVTSAHGTEK